MQGLKGSQLVGLPWRWQGPGWEPKTDERGNVWFEIRVAELPDFFVAAPTRDEVLDQATTALAAFLDSYLSADEEPPLPDGIAITKVEIARYQIPGMTLQAA